MAAEPRIFVSYARGDGREFAIGLRQQLEAHGFPLWQDLADLEGGRDWWRQITEAIDACEYLVLVLTPRAVASETVRREWRYARQQGRCVVAVYGTKGLDLGPLPGWMRRTHVYDLDEPDQVRRFTRQLEGPCEAARVPRMVEELADDFVERPAELESLVAKLLDEAREEPVAITAALKGAGGYGKTTLARALCHDERVQDAFHDGILWVTLGEAPGDLTGRVIDLIQVLTGERPGFTSITAATSRLAELLSDRYLLLVIDDVWHRADAEPFLQGGKTTCARLIITRNRDTLPAGAAPVDVEEMRAREAVSLLRFGLPAGGDATFEALAARLGEWPLLLKLANGALRARVEYGQALTDALAWVGQALDRRGVQAFDPQGEAELRNTVEGALNASLDQFEPDARARLTELAVFPEDLDVPLVAVERLWQHTGEVKPFDAEKILTRLLDLSLLHLDLAERTLRLHDVVRYYLGSQVDLPALHRQLVEAYRETCGGRWSEVEDDGYVLGHLIAHLIAAGQGDEARGLMFDLGWLRRKLEGLGINALLEDGGRFEGDQEVRLLTRSLGHSRHVVSRDPHQLEAQILGRLGLDHGPNIARLIRAARAEASHSAPIQPPDDLDGFLRQLRQHVDQDLVFNELFMKAANAIFLQAARDCGFSEQDGRIEIEFDEAGRVFSISDNGIGLTTEEVEASFLVIDTAEKRAEILHDAAKRYGETAAALVRSYGIGIVTPLIISRELKIVSRPFDHGDGFEVRVSPAGHYSMSASSPSNPGTTVSLELIPEIPLRNAAQIEQTVLRNCRSIPVPIHFNPGQREFWPGMMRPRLQIDDARFTSQIADLLVREEFAFQEQPDVGGLRPDFLVYGPHGRSVLLEAKEWATEPGFMARALNQVNHYKNATAASALLVVLPRIDQSLQGGDVADLTTLGEAIRRIFRESPTAKCPAHKAIRFGGKTIFAAMPFSAEYDDTFFVAMAPAAEDIGAVCVRLDQEEFSGDIVRRIQDDIVKSIAIIADLSEAKPNVLYEIGYAHALKKPAVHISSTPEESVPFDVRNWSTIRYAKGRTHQLRVDLVKRLRSILRAAQSEADPW